MRRMIRGLVAAMEQEEIELDVLEDQTVEDLPIDGDPAIEINDQEIEQQNSNVESAIKELDSVGEVANALESIRDIFSAAADNGGFKIENAAVVNVAVESILFVTV